MNKTILVEFGMDGNSWYARFDDFIDLQESDCGFGDTPQEALEDLINQEPTIFTKFVE